MESFSNGLKDSEYTLTMHIFIIAEDSIKRSFNGYRSNII